MTRKCVTDEQYGNLNRRLDEVKRRVDEGTLAYNATMSAIQALIEGRRITIDYGLTLADMIAAGRYDWTNSDITAKRFPLNGGGKVDVAVELVHFDRSISSDDAIAEMRRRGLRPATLAELLAYGAKFPEEQCKFPIVALGSVTAVDGYRFVPYLCGVGSKRDLYLYWWDVDWNGDYRFLAVRN